MAARKDMTICQLRAENHASERRSGSRLYISRLLKTKRMRVLRFHDHVGCNIQYYTWPTNLIGLMYCRMPFAEANVKHLADTITSISMMAGVIVAFAPLHGHAATKEFYSSYDEQAIPISDIVKEGYANALYSKPYCRARLPAQWDRIAVALGPMVRPVRHGAEVQMTYQEELKYLLHVSIHVRPHFVLLDGKHPQWGHCLSRCLGAIGMVGTRSSESFHKPDLAVVSISKSLRGSVLKSTASSSGGINAVTWAAQGIRPEYALGSNGEIFTNYVAPHALTDTQHGMTAHIQRCASKNISTVEIRIKTAYMNQRVTSIKDIIRILDCSYERNGGMYITKIVAWSPATHENVTDINPRHGAVICVEGVVCNHQDIRVAVSLGPHFEKHEDYW